MNRHTKSYVLHYRFSGNYSATFRCFQRNFIYRNFRRFHGVNVTISAESVLAFLSLYRSVLQFFYFFINHTFLICANLITINRLFLFFFYLLLFVIQKFNSVLWTSYRQKKKFFSFLSNLFFLLFFFFADGRCRKESDY